MSRLSPTRADVHAAGIALLVTGDWDRAVGALEMAAGMSPSTVEVYSDLSAAYIGRAQAQGQDDDWVHALASAEAALRNEPRHREALFNRALALRALSLDHAAGQTLDELLAEENDYGWRKEASQIRQTLRIFDDGFDDDVLSRFEKVSPADVWDSAERLVLWDAQRVREYFEDTVLAAWNEEGHRVEDGQIRAAALARALAARGDTLPLDALTVHSTPRNGALPTLRRACRLWSLGRRQYRSYEMERMTATFGQAARMFERAGSPMALWARHYVVVGLYYQGRIDQAEVESQRLLDELRFTAYEALHARTLWLIGTLHFQRGRFEQALMNYEDAKDRFAHLHERDNELAMHQLIAEAYGRLGDSPRSWRHHRAALAGRRQSRDSRRRHVILAAAGYSALNLGVPDVARLLFAEAIRAASTLDAAVPLVEAYLNHARASAALGDVSSAEHGLELAQAQLARILDQGIANRYGGDLMAARAELLLSREPAAAYDHALLAIDRGLLAGSQFRTAHLRLLAGRAARQLGNRADALHHFEQGIAHLETRRALIEQRQLRISFHDSVWNLYRERVELAIDAGDHIEALTWIERSRARMLLDDLTGPGARTATVQSIQASLRPGAALVVYFTQEARLLSWLVTREDILFAARTVEVDWIRSEIGALTNALERGDRPEVARSARRLGEVLLDPLSLTHRKLSVLAVSPDHVIEPVPFALLKDDRGSEVVRSTATAIVPSGTVMIALSRSVSNVRRVAAIGASEVAPAMNRFLARLAGVDDEVRAVARMYPAATMAIGPDATPTAFLQALASADVVHFAGHAIADAGHPWRARLILAPEGGADGVLTLEQIPLQGSRASTVVLSGCETGLGRPSRGEGLLSISRPLLASGVRNVVVTKWKVNDDAMRTLAEAFHRELARPGSSAAEALRSAQLTLLKDETSMPHIWASLEVQGAIH